MHNKFKQNKQGLSKEDKDEVMEQLKRQETNISLQTYNTIYLHKQINKSSNTEQIKILAAMICP